MLLLFHDPEPGVAKDVGTDGDRLLGVLVDLIVDALFEIMEPQLVDFPILDDSRCR